MKIGRFWTLMIAAGPLALGMVWQSSRFADLSAKAGELEAEQENWIARNRKIEAEIALLSSRERTEAMANRLGLKRALPEDKLKIILAPAAGSASAANPPGGASHD
jgi:cell division protein FtsL